MKKLLVLSCLLWAACGDSEEINTKPTNVTDVPAATVAGPTKDSKPLDSTETFNNNTSSVDIYTAADEDVVRARYFDQQGKQYVGIKEDNETEYILLQVPGSAFAKGADYEADGVRWEVSNDKAFLKKGGRDIEYTWKGSE